MLNRNSRHYHDSPIVKLSVRNRVIMDGVPQLETMKHYAIIYSFLKKYYLNYMKQYLVSEYKDITVQSTGVYMLYL